MAILNFNEPNFVSKNILQLVFFLIINIIFLNVIFGIIIDTFSQLRAEQDAKELDKKNVCFVAPAKQTALGAN